MRRQGSEGAPRRRMPTSKIACLTRVVCMAIWGGRVGMGDLMCAAGDGEEAGGLVVSSSTETKNLTDA